MEKKIFIFSLILSFSFLLSCDKDDDKKDDTKTLYIGVIVPLDDLSGSLLQYPIKAVIDEVNENGGLSGDYHLQLDIRSSEPLLDYTRLQQGTIISESLINEHQKNLVGFVISSSSAVKGAVSEITEKNKISTVSGYSTSEANTGLSDYFHRTTCSDKLRAKLLAQKTIDFGLTKVAIGVEGEDNFSLSFANDFLYFFEELGGEITDTVHFKRNDSEYKNKLEKLYQNNPHSILMSFLNIHAEFFNKLNDYASSLNINKDSLLFMVGFKINNLLYQANFDFLLGKLNEVPRFYGLQIAIDESTESYQYLENLIINKYASSMYLYNTHTYDATYILVMAIEKALLDGFSPDNINEFRIAVNERIRPVSKPDGEIVRPEMTWQTIKTIIANGDVNYEGVANNSDIDEQGQAQDIYEMFVIKKNGNEFYYDIP